MKKRINILILTTLTVFFSTHSYALGNSWPPVTSVNGSPSLAPMLEKVLPGVVNIATSGTVAVNQNPMFNDPFFRHFFGNVPQQQQKKRTQSIGSGVIFNAQDGYIITNHHVIANADTIFVTLQDKRRLKAILVGSDSETDIAVLQVKERDITAIPLANSSASRVGDFVVAIGNPFGLGQTVTSGIISALGRSGLGIEGYENFIQTDASINPGNSGGALINLNGELIGVNTAIIGPSGGNVGIGFAIPVNMVNKVINQLIEHGSIKRGLIGVQAQDLTPDLAEALQLDSTVGTLISSVIKGGAAEKAGIKEGDVITHINGQAVKHSSNLRNIIGLKRVGERVDIDIIRNGRNKRFKVKIQQADSISGNTNHIPLLKGAEFSKVPQNHPLYRHIDGVMVSALEPGSIAARSGLEPGDIIVAANRQAVSSVNHFLKIADAARGDLLLRIQRGNSSLFVVLR